MDFGEAFILIGSKPPPKNNNHEGALAVLFLTQREERSILTPNQQNASGKGRRGDDGFTEIQLSKSPLLFRDRWRRGDRRWSHKRGHW